MDAATFDAILADVAAGEAAYKAMAAREVPRKAFYAYVATDEQAGNKYARAKQAGLEVLADEIMEISDAEPEMVEGMHGTHRDQAFVSWAKNRIDSRKWLLSKLAPKKYGDKVDLTHAGPDGGAIVHEVRRTVIDPRNTDA